MYVAQPVQLAASAMNWPETGKVGFARGGRRTNEMLSAACATALPVRKRTSEVAGAVVLPEAA